MLTVRFALNPVPKAIQQFDDAADTVLARIGFRTTPPYLSASMAVPADFQELVASRRTWIDDVLRPWCRKANQKELRQAEQEWLDIAGRVDVQATLWTWAWERFDALTWPDLAGVNETRRVHVTLRDGATSEGFPDSRESVRGALVLVDRDESGAVIQHGPWSIDDIQSVSVREEDA